MIIIDDPISSEGPTPEQQIEQSRKWLEEVLPNRRLPPGQEPWIVMARLEQHEEKEK